jgi:hypothetical protein
LPQRTPAVAKTAIFSLQILPPKCCWCPKWRQIKCVDFN